MKYARTIFTILTVVLFVVCFAPRTTFAAGGCYFYNQNLPGYVFTTPQPDVHGNCPSGPNGERGEYRTTTSDATAQQGKTLPNNLSYTQLEPLPGQPNGQADFCGLLNYLFKALIYLGGGVAVLFIVLSGITYMVSEVVDNKTKARDRIRAAVIGLAVLLASWIILNTVNPQIVKACTILEPTKTGLYIPAAPVSTCIGAGCITTEEGKAVESVRQNGVNAPNNDDLVTAPAVAKAQVDACKNATGSDGSKNTPFTFAATVSPEICTNFGFKTCTQLVGNGKMWCGQK